MKNLTIADIAQLAGVNKSTVSRALSGSDKVNAETRERIREIARKHHFTPNQAAQTLATGTVKSIAVILMNRVAEPSIINTVFPQQILGISQVAAKYGYNVTIITTKAERDEDYLKIVANRQADGFVVINCGVEDTFPYLFHREKIPFVIASPFPGVENYVSTDNELGGYLAVRHLLELGHRRVVVLGGSMKWYHNQYRIQGVRRAYEEFDVSYEDNCLVHMELNSRESYDTFAGIALRGELPDAVFCLCHTATVGFTAAAYDAGIDFPRDVSLITFSNQLSVNYLRPSMTAVEERIVHQSERLTESLFQQILHPEQEIVSQTIAPTLVVRKSTREKQ